MLPPLSARIHKAIKASRDCQIIDINTNCVGLITGTTMAVERMKGNQSIKYVMVIGTEVLSKYVDKTDKFTAPFFSDGASGVLLGRVPQPFGLLASSFCTDSSVYEEVKLERGGFIYQNGKATWTQAITNLPYVMKGLTLDFSMIDFFIFHQANKVLIDYIMDKHNIPHEKTYTNVEDIGNTGAASIGIALDHARRHGLLKHNALVMLAGVGAGFNFGANLWRWYER
jgi:3-oxoacyl-[acyl-carrier-protein] synthase-3